MRGKASRRDKADVITLEILERSHVNRLHITLHQRFVEVSAVLGVIAGSYSLQGLDRLTADAVRGLHSEAKHLGVTIELRSSAPEYASPPLVLTPTTVLADQQEVWVDTEVYLYGRVTNAGGKISPNIHLEGEDGVMYLISAREDQIQACTENILYRRYGVRARGKQRLDSRELGKDLELVEMFGFDPVYNPNELSEASRRATERWRSIGMTDEDILRELRG